MAALTISYYATSSHLETDSSQLHMHIFFSIFPVFFVMCIVLSYGQAHRLVMLFISSCANGKVNHDMLEQDRADLTQDWTFHASHLGEKNTQEKSIINRRKSDAQ